MEGQELTAIPATRGEEQINLRIASDVISSMRADVWYVLKSSRKERMRKK